MRRDVDSMPSVESLCGALEVEDCDDLSMSLLSMLNATDVTFTPGGRENLRVTGTWSEGANGKGGLLMMYLSVDGSGFEGREGRVTLLHLLGG